LILSILALAVGLILLTIAADRSVLAAARLSVHFGLSAVLIGALVIGVGTSIPELVVSLIAGQPAESMGNVVGSNISNLTLVLGSTAFLSVMIVPRSLLLRQGVLMFVAMAALALVLADGDIARVEGLVLTVAAVVAYFVLIRLARGPGIDAAELEEYERASIGLEMMAAPISLAVTVGGAWLLVWAAERIAEDVGLTSAFVGLVILAIGTSLPELATAVAASRRGEPELIIGNVVGSNIFNSLVVGGGAALAHPGAASDLGGATVLMVGVAAVTGALLFFSDRLGRRTGLVLLAGFVALIAVSL
jgi:cation:H+ antiporter